VSWRDKKVKMTRIILVSLVTFAFAGGAAEPAFAWWRGGWGGAGGWHGGWGGGCAWGGCGYGGAGAGLAAGLAIGSLAAVAASAAAASAPAYAYPAYGCVQRPIYDAWGRFTGYSC